MGENDGKIQPHHYLHDARAPRATQQGMQGMSRASSKGIHPLNTSHPLLKICTFIRFSTLTFVVLASVICAPKVIRSASGIAYHALGQPQVSGSSIRGQLFLQAVSQKQKRDSKQLQDHWRQRCSTSETSLSIRASSPSPRPDRKSDIAWHKRFFEFCPTRLLFTKCIT